MSLARHLPAGCALRRATVADAAHVAGLLRPVDRDEMEALEGRPAGEVLAGWLGNLPRVLMLRGEPALLYGIEACAGRPGHASPWLAIISTIAHDDLMSIMWLSRLQVDAWQRRWRTLQTVCDARNVFHRQWLEWLGFAPQGRVEGFGAAGLPFDLYSRHGGPTLH